MQLVLISHTEVWPLEQLRVCTVHNCMGFEELLEHVLVKMLNDSLAESFFGQISELTAGNNFTMDTKLKTELGEQGSDENVGIEND